MSKVKVNMSYEVGDNDIVSDFNAEGELVDIMAALTCCVAEVVVAMEKRYNEKLVWGFSDAFVHSALLTRELYGRDKVEVVNDETDR